MADETVGVREAEPPVNPYSLREAVNEASDTVNTGWLIFLALMAYVLIAVAGVSHRDLLLDTPVSLPIMQVSIPLKQFFTFAPVILLLFHLGVVAQLVLLARKTLAFDDSVRSMETGTVRTHPLRLELHSFFFVQAIAGPERSRVMSAFLHGMSWLTTVIIPVLLLLYIQIAFLPYHDVTVTWTHRVALAIDLSVLLLIGTFLLRAETSFFQAFAKNARAHPLNVSVTSLVLLFVLFVSFFVATVPGELLDRAGHAVLGAGDNDRKRLRPAGNGGGFAVSFLTANADGALLGLFQRNIIVTDTDLVQDKDVIEGEPTLSLRGRDLKFARLDRSDLHQADMTGADLSSASLINADLRGIRLTCANISDLILIEDRKEARCATARDANFSRARLEKARLSGTDFTSARFDDALLMGAEMAHVVLLGASLASANAAMTDMTGGIRADGANFLLASLRGADLTGAALSAADFSSADLSGAILNFARLEAAVLRDADLTAASLYRAKLYGAELSGVKLDATDLRGVSVWGATAPPADTTGLSDIGELRLAAPDSPERTRIGDAILSLPPSPAGQRVRLALTPLALEAKSDAWVSSPARAAWSALSAAAAPGPEGAGAQRLGQHLAGKMCRQRTDGGALATGIMRRAQTQQFHGDPRLISSYAANLAGCPMVAMVPEKVRTGFMAVVDDPK